MTSTTVSQTTRRPPEQPTAFLTAPFSGRTWRETLHLVLNLPVGVVAFGYAVTMLFLGCGLVVTFLGLPLLAAALVGARGFAAMERARARGLLRVEVEAPAPVVPRRGGLMGWVTAAVGNAAGWRAMVYAVLLLPFGCLSAALAVFFWAYGIAAALYPLYQWVFPRYVGWPGLQVYSNNGHTVYLSSVPEIAAVCAVGVVLVLLTPWLVRGLANLQRALVRGLCR